MLKVIKQKTLILTIMAGGIAGCTTNFFPGNSSSNQTTPTATITTTQTKVVTTTPVPTTKPTVAPLVANDPTGQKTYDLALDKAYSAANISQSAQSVDDWKLVESRWNNAITLLKSLPKTSDKYKPAQVKIKEYQRNLNIAKQKSNEAAILAKQPDSVRRRSSTTSAAIVGKNTTQSKNSLASGDVIQVPIKRRLSGTAVIDVTFNNQETFEMILDTGASGTVITESMAKALNVVPNGIIIASTPSQQAVPFNTGKIKSIEVGDAVINDVTVAIAPQLDIGLLGQDFFGRYEITLKDSFVEFRAK